MELKIGALNESDIDEICTFFTNERELYYSFPKLNFPITKNDFVLEIENRSNLVKVLYNNNLAGFGNLYDIKINEECFIGNVIVNPEYRNLGIGKYLIMAFPR
jgi:ribosomal protein S18 acetylase RimI-like enzyme